MSGAAPLDGIDLRRVEEVGLNALQTQRQLFYDGWLLRVSPGKAKRARSVNAHFGSSLPLAQKIPYCERIYAERGLPALFRMTPFVQPSGLEEELAARGYRSFEDTLVQVGRLDGPPEAPSVPGVDFVTPSPADFAEAVGELQQSSAEQRAALLERVAHTPLTTRAMIAVAANSPLAASLRPSSAASVAMSLPISGIRRACRDSDKCRHRRSRNDGTRKSHHDCRR